MIKHVKVIKNIIHICEQCLIFLTKKIKPMSYKIDQQYSARVQIDCYQ